MHTQKNEINKKIPKEKIKKYANLVKHKKKFETISKMYT